MKKIYKLFLMTAIAFGMVACSSDDVSQTPDVSKANTHVSVTLKLSSSASTRAAEDYNYVGEWAGKDNIKTVTIYLIDGNSVSTNQFTVDNGDYTVTTTTGEVILTPTTNAAIKTTSGPKKVYVLINGTSDVTTALSKTVPAEFEAAYNEVALKLSNSGISTTVETSASKVASASGIDSYDNIVMTNVSEVTINVAPNVTQAQTISAAEAKNRASVQVERAVARVMVTTKSTNYTIGTLGTISDVTWVLAQGENSLFVQRKSSWETPAHDWVSTTANYTIDAGGKYDYSGLFENHGTGFGGTTVPELSTYTALAGTNQSEVLNSLGLDAKAVNGKFILPTTHENGVEPLSKYKKGNTAYVLVRAKFKPTKVADGGSLTNDTFYLGGVDGKFYSSETLATEAGNSTVAKYVGGKVLYYAWVNPDNVDTKKWYNSPVLRNNIYHIHITGFKNLGTNWNPLYPNDPTTNPDPKPAGTLEPTNPIDPNDPLTTPETWMSVDVKVLPWKVHSYSVELGM